MDDNTLFAKKLTQASEIMSGLGIDAWLIFCRETALNPDPATELLWDLAVIWPAAFVICADGRRFATAVVHDVPTLQRTGLFSEILPFEKVPEETLPTLLQHLDPANIALNYSEENVAADGLSHGLFLRLLRMLADTPLSERFCSAEKLIGLLRQRKLDCEMRRLLTAAETADGIFSAFGERLHPGLSETEMADLFREQMTALGVEPSWDAHMCPNINAGPNTGRGHMGPRPDVVIERGHILNVDFGVKQAGYSSDQQRMWYLLREGETNAPAAVQEPFDAVVGAIQAGFRALQPGIPGCKVDAAARAYLVSRGYPEYLHALGHNVGRYAHDGGEAMLCPPWPSYGARAHNLLEHNQLLTLELGIWTDDGYFGLEEEALITEDGARWFWPPQTELRLIG